MTSSSRRRCRTGPVASTAAFRGRSRWGRPRSNNLVELVRSAAAFRDVTVLSWHGGNAKPVARAVARLRSEGRRVRLWEPHVDGGDAHAGRVETSLMLALAPELVRDERPVGATQPIDELLPRLRRTGSRPYRRTVSWVTPAELPQAKATRCSSGSWPRSTRCSTRPRTGQPSGEQGGDRHRRGARYRRGHRDKPR